MALKKIYNTDYSEEVLRAIDEMPIRELFVKLEVLTWEEEPIKEIQGVLTGGNISINGKSAVRRTCSLNFITADDTIEDYIQLDTKFRLFVGLKNHLPINYKSLGEILWFKQGLFVFTKASFSHNASGTTVNVTAQDKMCLLNGTCGGTIADFVTFHEIEMTVADRIEELTAKKNNIKYQIKIKDTGVILQSDFETQREAATWGEEWQKANPGIALIYESYDNITGEEEEELALLTSGGYDLEDIIYVPVLIYTLIQECVNHYGREKLQNIRIDNVPLEAKSLLEYRGNRPVYFPLNKEGAEPYYAGNISFDLNEASQWENGYDTYNAGDLVGYKMTAFTWPGELCMAPGSSVTEVLDKVKNVLGNFEYFYDIDGVFHFQEIKNYLNNSYIPLTELNEHQYEADFSTEEIVYSFKNNPTLITAYSNNPKYEDIKNDFVVWGNRENANGSTTKIRYHLAIDSKPNPTNGDWRETIYQQVKDATDEDGLNFYKKEFIAEWRNLYNPDNTEWFNETSGTYWNPNVEENPSVLNYFIDFIDDSGPYGKWSINKIGRRTLAKEDKDCVAVLNKRIPDYIFVTSKDEFNRLVAEGYTNAFLVDSSFLENYFSISSNRKTCLDVIREMLYTNLSLNESISITALPIYWLEPNRIIEVEDIETRIYGQYEINSITIPLTYNGTMSLSCSRVLNRI